MNYGNALTIRRQFWASSLAGCGGGNYGNEYVYGFFYNGNADGAIIVSLGGVGGLNGIWKNNLASPGIVYRLQPGTACSTRLLGIT